MLAIQDLALSMNDLVIDTQEDVRSVKNTGLEIQKEMRSMKITTSDTYEAVQSAQKGI